MQYQQPTIKKKGFLILQTCFSEGNVRLLRIYQKHYRIIFLKTVLEIKSIYKIPPPRKNLGIFFLWWAQICPQNVTHKIWPDALTKDRRKRLFKTLNRKTKGNTTLYYASVFGSTPETQELHTIWKRWCKTLFCSCWVYQKLDQC